MVVTMHVHAMDTLLFKVYGQGLDPEISQNLLSLIAEERNLRLHLETEADKLEKEINALTIARTNGKILKNVLISNKCHSKYYLVMIKRMC